MIRKAFAIAASAASILAAGAAGATDFPLSVNDAGPVIVEQHAQPAAQGSTSGGSYREVASDAGARAAYEVRTPSSVDESAPWLTGRQTSTSGAR